MTENSPKPKKHGMVHKLKKAVLGCGGDCGEGCAGCSNEIRIVRKKDTDTEEKN